MMGNVATLLHTIGGEAGCQRLSREFYARVANDPLLRPLFPGKSLRCATEEFAAFLIQFLGGDEQQTQYRWHLSLRESHARFRISAAQRNAWLKNMRAALRALPLDSGVQRALGEFFEHSSAYVIGRDNGEFRGPHNELADRWQRQRTLDKAVAAIDAGRDDEAISLALQFASRPTVLVGLAAQMMKTGRAELVDFVTDLLKRNPALAAGRFNGRTLLHHAAGAGCIDVAALILKNRGDPDIADLLGHTPLYRVANECWTAAGPQLVRLLVAAGANVNACGGVTRATPLHMAARRGFVVIAQALIECGASLDARDTKGATPLQRAINCRRREVVAILQKAAVEQSASTRRLKSGHANGQ